MNVIIGNRIFAGIQVFIQNIVIPLNGNKEDLSYFQKWYDSSFDLIGRMAKKADVARDFPFTEGYDKGILRCCFPEINEQNDCVILRYDFKEYLNVGEHILITEADKDRALETLKKYKEQCSHIIRDCVENDCPTQSFKEGAPNGQCDGDGHYMCRKCEVFNPESKEYISGINHEIPPRKCAAQYGNGDHCPEVGKHKLVGSEDYLCDECFENYLNSYNKKVIFIEGAEQVLELIRNNVSGLASLMGSFGKGAFTSTNGISILIPDALFNTELKDKLTKLLNTSKVEDNDWGGWHFSDTVWGDIDLFSTTNEFNY